MKRKRSWGGATSLPTSVRECYSTGEAAALVLIGLEVKKNGFCDMKLDKIAAAAGVCRTTVQNALRRARQLGHIQVRYRPVKGQKSLPNIIRIVCQEWVDWIKRAIGFKEVHPSMNPDINKTRNNGERTPTAAKRAYERENAAADERKTEIRSPTWRTEADEIGVTGSSGQLGRLKTG
ncbi:hypothetical protein [Pararhizobium gei]|uniref:hypothetical protein n=1 Tax=Pararhizobium gei TaxID=1395951 RepID=UPI0023DBF6F8|nr:hypothetical protein [Rhizobium gei]